MDQGRGGEGGGPSGLAGDLVVDSKEHPMPKALIVEDEPQANELLSMLVQLRGYQTDSAFTGGEALAKADRARPDIVFLDLMLPDINGYDVCRALKGSRETTAIPVVMVTARYAEENRLQGFRAGATDYISKPYTPDQIFGAMAEADSWARGHAERQFAGEIAVDARDEVAHLRQITRLWSLLLERSRLPEEDARAIDEFLVEFATRALERGSKDGVGRLATIAYRLDPGEITLSLLDGPGGWSSADSASWPGNLGGLIAQAGFEEVRREASEGRIVLVRRPAPGGT